MISIQHEYGIWGGPDGEYVLDFVRALRRPVVTTLHTVLRRPTPSQRQILATLVRPVDDDGGDVPGRGDHADPLVRRRRAAARDRAPRRAEPAARGSGHHQAAARPRGPERDPQLRAPRSRQGLRVRDRGDARRCEGDPVGRVRDPRGDAPGPPGARRRGLSRAPRGGRCRGRGDRLRAVHRPVRRARGARDVARGRGPVRHPVPEPGPDRVRDAVVRDGLGQGGRVHPLRLRQGAARRRPGTPRGSRVLCGPCRRVHRPARESRAANGDRQARLRVQPGHGVVERGRRVQHRSSRGRPCPFRRPFPRSPGRSRGRSRGSRPSVGRRPLHPVNRQHLAEITGELGIWQHATGRGAQPGLRVLH